MWFFNLNAINNLLLSFLLFVMIIYFIIRSVKNKEIIFILIFMIQLFLWQLCFLFRNAYLDPLSAYPLYYFLNSGYTVFSYHALVMFSYYFITPVFPKETKTLFYAGLIISFSIILFSLFFVFTQAPTVVFDSTLHVYDAKPASHRKIILITLLIFIIVTAKNLIYKVFILKGEQKIFVRNISIALLTGTTAVVGVSFINVFYPINQHIHNTINTQIAGFLFIYFYLSYLSYHRIAFFYADKAIFLVIFILIIISSLLTSFAFVIYEKMYLRNINEVTTRIVKEIEYSGVGGSTNKRIENLYADLVSYVLLEDYSDKKKIIIFNKGNLIDDTKISYEGKSNALMFHPGEEAKNLCFERKTGNYILHTGIPYVHYRENIHSFVKTSIMSLAVVIVFIFVFFRFVILVGLTQPLRKIRKGISEIRKGNINYKIDISDRDELGLVAEQFNKMIDDIKKKSEEIIKSEEKYRELTSLLPDIIYETDVNLNITYFNKTGIQITGYTEENIAEGISLKDLFEENECSRLAHLLLEKNTDRTSYGISRTTIKKNDGKYIYVENNAVPVFIGEIPVGIRGVMRDVSEKIQMEQNLIQAQKMETIGTLAGGIAHDFNNILTGIIGTISILEMKLQKNLKPSKDDIIKAISIIKKSSEKASNVVKQLLMVSRKQKPNFDAIDINNIAKNIYEICYNSFDKKIQLNFSFLGEEALILADDTQIAQMLLNLCVNARDAMTIMRPPTQEQGGVLSLSIEKVKADRNFKERYPEAVHEDYIKIHVSDTGVGIEEKNLSRIFDPFFTTKPKEKGTGLGLAMVYNIVKQHNGFIIMNSTVSVGTTVNVYIPSVSAKTHIKDIIFLPQKEVFKNKGTILLVDDDSTVQMICSDILKMLGFSVINAYDGKQCIEMFREKKNDINAVILDVMMPVMSGDETLTELFKMNPNIKVLISSGFREDPRISHMLMLGAKGFLQKPYTIEKLAEALSTIFENDSITHI